MNSRSFKEESMHFSLCSRKME